MNFNPEQFYTYKSLFSVRRVQTISEHPKLEQQAKRKWKLAVETATEIGLKVLRNNWNDRKDLNLGLSFEELEKEIVNSTLINKHYSDEKSEGEIPTMEDIKVAYRMIARLGQEVSMDDVLDQIEKNVKKDGRLLKNDWRVVIEKKL